MGKMADGAVRADEIAAAFVAAGGKRLRPRLLREIALALGAADDAHLASLADAVERLHKATLVHDDIQDGDELRDGRPAVWRTHGVPIAIAVGDLLFAQAFRLIAESGYPNAGEMLKVASAAMAELCAGQADELTGQGDYLSICRRKTGALFGLAASLGALAAGADHVPYREWGLTYGTLYQIRDDIADGDVAAELRALERRLLSELAEKRPAVAPAFVRSLAG